ncbi:MAG: TRAP transporter substrate-binding protein DctP [Gammaproteobacteria bacterium]|nr:MAG: TRAP transporter substrate-binding protein DctP [Gammaproteobacteria bacterium]
MDRRKFVGAAGLAGAAGLLSACTKQTPSQADSTGPSPTETFVWKMVTSWPRDFPGLGTGASHLAESIDDLSNGRLKIKVYGANELVPAFEVFDTVSQGTAEMGHSATYYWKGKVPAAQFFAGIPFGMTAQELHGWIYYAGGLELWQEVYAPHGLIPFLAGSSGPQMGGWFNREINSLDDLKGLKMRIPGPGGEILKRAGGTPTTIPGAELFTALQTGTIDATEWVGPFNDLAFGLFRAAKYYYYPGWHEPGTGLELMINAEAWNTLPADLQAIVKIASQAAVTDTLSDFTYNNGIALRTLLKKHGVQLRRFPDEVLSRLNEISDEVIREMADNSELAGRIYASFKAYQEIVNPWTAISDRTLLNLRPDP